MSRNLSSRLGRSLWIFLACGLALGPSPAAAHLAIATRSLRTLIAQSELVIRARMIGQGEVVAHDSGARRPILEVQVLEVLKGPEIGRKIRFAQHGHGVATFEPGSEALFFLRPIAESRELRELESSTGLRWFSDQEHDDAYVLRPESRSKTLAAARSYAKAGRSSPAARARTLRRATVEMLASRDTRLAESALHDLVRSPQIPKFSNSEVRRLIAVVHDPRTTVGVRTALLVQLDRGRLVDAPAEWAKLLAETNGSDKVAVIRAAGAQPSAPTEPSLRDLLDDPDAEISAAAAFALGKPGRDSVVTPLFQVIAADTSRRTSMAAIRSLGVIATPDAEAALRRVAEESPDETLRDRAAAELRRLAIRPR